jgi:hypothetical protein
MKKIAPLPVWKEFSQQWTVDDIRIGDSIDPFDKRAYAWRPLPQPGEALPEKELSLAAGQQRVYTVALAVADSPLSAYGVLASLKRESGWNCEGQRGHTGSASQPAGEAGPS